MTFSDMLALEKKYALDITVSEVTDKLLATRKNKDAKKKSVVLSFEEVRELQKLADGKFVEVVNALLKEGKEVLSIQ